MTPDYFNVREWEVVNGRLLEGEDIANGAKVAVVGRTTVEKLFNGENPLGQEIRVNPCQ